MSAEYKRRFVLYEKLASSPLLQELALRRCADDPDYYFQNFAWTFWKGHKPYLLPTINFEFQDKCRKLFVGYGGPEYLDPTGGLRNVYHDKSRRIGATDVAIDSTLYMWRFRDNCDIGFLSKTASDVDNMTPKCLFGRARRKIMCWPEWFRPDGWRQKGRNKIYNKKMALINPDNNSNIIGTAATEDPFRGEDLTRAYADEVGFNPNFESGVLSLEEAAQAVYYTTTANGPTNYAARLVRGEESEIHPFPSTGQYGFVHVRTHWSEDPRVDEEFIAKLEAKYRNKPEKRAQEMEIDYLGSVSGRVWPELNAEDHLLTQKEWEEDYIPALHTGTLMEGWDFGSGEALTEVVYAYHFEATDVIVVTDYAGWSRTDYDTIADDVGDKGYFTDKNPTGMLPKLRVGDIAMISPDSMQGSWKSNLDSRGIRIRGRKRKLHKSLEEVRRRLLAGTLVFAPCTQKRYNKSLPSIFESVLSYKWARPKKEDVGGPESTSKKEYVPKNDVHSHGSDALTYIVAWATQRSRTAILLQKEIY